MRKYILLITMFLVVGMVTSSPAQTWSTEQVTNNSAPDMYPLATTVSSGLMVAYTHDDGDDEIFFADNFMGPWTTSRVTDNTEYDVGFDIAAQHSEQTAHISIYLEGIPDSEIEYCEGYPGSWNIQRVTDDDNNDQWPSLAIDKSGNIHMAFAKAGTGGYEIFYANNLSGSWVAEQVTDNATRDASPWIALDSDDKPNIVYMDVSSLRHTRKTSGIWTSPELVASGVATTSYPFLIMDAEDNCHVTYSKKDGTYFNIYYANNVTGSWQEGKVTTNDYDDENPTLFLDPDGKVHIAYMAHEGGDAEIFYAHNTPGIWMISRVTDNSVDDIAQFGRFFAVDHNGIGHIFFTNDSDGDDEIYHAYSNSPLFEGVGEKSPASNSVLISLDWNNFTSATEISYSVPASGNISLKIYDASGSLVKTMVDGVKQKGEYTATWNGTTNNNIHAAPGIYFYQLTTNGQTASAKGILK